MAAPENSESRQRVVRIKKAVDDWLADRARKAKKKNPDVRHGVATEINAFINQVYEEHTGRKA